MGGADTCSNRHDAVQRQRRQDKYRGTCLLTIISRITAKVAVRRIARYAEQEKLLNNAQWGFRRGRSTRDAIITLRMMAKMCADHEERCRQKIESLDKQGGAQEEIEEMKKTMGENRGMEQLIDTQKAYPNFSRELAWQVLRKYGLSENLVRVVSTLHEDTVYEVKMTNTKSEKYKYGEASEKAVHRVPYTIWSTMLFKILGLCRRHDSCGNRPLHPTSVRGSRGKSTPRQK